MVGVAPYLLTTCFCRNHLVLNIYAFDFLEPVRICIMYYNILIHIWNFNLILSCFYRQIVLGLYIFYSDLFCFGCYLVPVWKLSLVLKLFVSIGNRRSSILLYGFCSLYGYLVPVWMFNLISKLAVFIGAIEEVQFNLYGFLLN